MPEVVDTNRMMLKAKYRAKKNRYVVLEVEVEGNLNFLTSFYKEFSESFMNNN